MIQLAFILSLSVLFIHYTMREHEIFGFVQNWFWALNDKIKKPFFGCPICMVPWWGSLIMWTGYLCGAWPLPTLFEWLLTLAIAGGINSVLSPMLPE